jgi:AraC family transcriptional regulator, regulatory protein of adaptative response / DNA-3-methyladenine glycosylase II
LRVPGAWDAFELAVRALLGQQISVKGATTLAGRLVRAFGAPLAHPDGDLTHLFPTPAALADADVASIGLPRARAETIRRLALLVRDGDLALGESSDEDEARAALAKIPGIGPWTIEYSAMRAFAAPDAFPSSDLGIGHALSRKDKRPSARDVERIAEAWRPWRAYAAMHLWSGSIEDED